jgi:hypothetical protein
MADLNEEMVASYEVTVVGIDRTRAQVDKLGKAIADLRSTKYGGSGPGTLGVSDGPTNKIDRGAPDVFVTKINALEGNIQSVTMKALAAGMALGKRSQAAVLRAATTKTGLSGQSKVGGRKGPGRDDSGAMINAIATNVEQRRTASVTQYTGWHGWQRQGRAYYELQENGTKGKGGASKGESKSEGFVYRAPNKPKSRVSGSKTPTRSGGAVPAANSLGKTIPTVREYLRTELDKLR